MRLIPTNRVGTRMCLTIFFAMVLPGSSAQVPATVDAPKPIYQVGETLEIIGRFKEPLNFDSGRVYFEAEPDNPNPSKRRFSCVRLLPKGTKNFTVGCPISLDAVPGPWHIIKVIFVWGDDHQNVLSETPYKFEVKDRSDLKIPQSAEILLNPSQIQLFRGEAHEVQFRIQELKIQLTGLGNAHRPSEVELLKKNVTKALSRLRDTEDQFLRLAPSSFQVDGAKIFFDDLARDYDNAERNLVRKNITEVKSSSPRLVFTAETVGFSPLAQVVLRALEHNELAYASVADSSSFYLNLRVESEPSGALITYKRRGDPAYQSSKDPTNSTILIPKATTVIHFHLDGWQDTEVEFRPRFASGEDVVFVRLKK